jgi:S1-C subfamily serine protease
MKLALRLPPDWLLYGTVVALMLIYAYRGQDHPVAPAPPSPELGPILPSESPRDPRILVDVAAPSSGVGTAFASTADGEWLTARHVVDSCDTIGVKIGDRRLIRVSESTLYENADLATLKTEWTRTPLPTDLNSQRKVGETGYFFGFPQGRPGEVVGRLLSRGRMEVRGRYRSDEPVLIWTEIARTRGLRGSLGGLSGSPVLDADGEVVGLVTAESPRRGRVYTVAPRQLSQIIGQDSEAASPISYDDFAVQADRLRRDRRIAQIVCINKDS